MYQVIKTFRSVDVTKQPVRQVVSTHKSEDVANKRAIKGNNGFMNQVCLISFSVERVN